MVGLEVALPKVEVAVAYNEPVIKVSPAKLMVVPVAVILPELSMANLAVAPWTKL